MFLKIKYFQIVVTMFIKSRPSFQAGITPPFSDLLSNPLKGYAVLNMCLQEVFQFHVANPSQVSLRCLCKRDGCNLPMNFTSFLDYNKLAMPEIHI
ncbi:Ovule protein [Caenorhabditis elegans]|uniref:Ovule protein n=1 Tax=Caenorhabditis elegans TaxID=6239 RepID=G5EBL7_CAEEL|nr:Ovule protein [Caenorhabditis elegans]CAE17896.2 Ovule protein [Caenorhabditis elegans]